MAHRLVALCFSAIFLFASKVVFSEVYVFDTKEEMDEFMLDLAAQAAWEESLYSDDWEDDLLDSCTFYYPECYSVSFLHLEGERGEHWHAVTGNDIDCDDDVCEICSGDHIHSDVDGMKMYWKTTQSDACDWCAEGTSKWDPEYYKRSTQQWLDCTEDDDCVHIFGSDDIVYWGEELTYYNNFDFYTTDKVGRFRDKWNCLQTVELRIIDCGPE